MILDKLCLRGKITTVHAEQIKEQLKSFIDQNFIGKEEVDNKIEKAIRLTIRGYKEYEKDDWGMGTFGDYVVAKIIKLLELLK
jgi:hypothetical protein